MIGLIKKDLLMIKGNLKSVSIILIVFLIMTLQGNMDTSFLPSFISVMLMASTFSYDEYNKTDAYISTFKNGRINSVRAKYLATLVTVTFMLLLTLIIFMIVRAFGAGINIKEVVETSIVFYFVALIIHSVFYPIIYKWGIEKGRILIFVFVFGLVLIISLLARWGLPLDVSDTFKDFLNQYALLIILFVTVLALTISYNISKKIYLKKEF